MDILQTVLIAIVEGLTEFLPVSSTGHMVITEGLLGVQSNDFVKAFTVNIQFGAILSVVVLYWRRFFKTTPDFYFKLFVGFLPAAIVGFLLDDYIDQMLGSVLVVAISLVVGGIVLIFIDNLINRNHDTAITYKNSFITGCIQCIAMIPGVSRSAATIIGGMLQGLTRKTAAEFSFFLAVPTMLAASGYKLMKNYEMFTADSHNLQMLLLGNVVAFIVAMLAIKFFIGFLQKNGFKVFGYYRIVVGGIILALYYAGYALEVS